MCALMRRYRDTQGLRTHKKNTCMAIAHLSSQIISGSRSVVGCAAYRHRTAMIDNSTGETWRYAADPDLVHAEIALPAGAPAWAKALLTGRAPAAVSCDLWNIVTAKEQSTRYDAQLAREFNIALPVELSRDQNVVLARRLHQG